MKLFIVIVSWYLFQYTCGAYDGPVLLTFLCSLPVFSLLAIDELIGEFRYSIDKY